ncbi:hypothetical protein FALBO_10025 [Fusarium albosuccineum]|uniref:Heterokaryon incompatibility domain-containing protein n=1 Tax=Fusarium albosuccineum TaxID=1237068 RepID=A0A8H4L561_9HYPO|nr:hypothetical protein FALBO_10025 [Fusarium albosuccineum]
MEDIPKQPDDLAWRQFVRNHPLGEGYATPDTNGNRNAPNPGISFGPSLPASRSTDELSLALHTRRTPTPQEKGNSNDIPGLISTESPSMKLIKGLYNLAFPRPLAEALRPEDLSLCSHCDELIAKGDDAFRSTSSWEPGAFTAGSSCPLCRLISDCSNPTTSLGDRNQAMPRSPKSYPRLEIGKLDEFMHGVMSRAPLEDDSRTDSECAFQLAAAWMHRCLERHDRCNATGDIGPPTLPTRVIDVGPSDASQLPRLCKGEGKKDHYLTLSYRWDQNSVASSKTVKGNLEGHEKGIALDTLPQIMQDAIHITRKLGLRYLWIDALCIIQDSREDWQAEAGDMANTYKRSTVTLAAAADTGNGDASETIFRERSKSHIRPLRCRGGWLDGSATYIFADRTSTKDGSRPQSVLDTRGWVLQEHLLSPRVLTYSHGEIFWDCVCLNASETFPGGIPAFYDTDLKAVDFRLFKKAILGSGEGNMKPRQLHKLWHSIVEEYSRRKLTLETDKLAALSGLAKEMTNVLRDDFVLGLWKKTLWRDLLWWVKSPATATIPTGFIAPSWSWAAVNGAISYGLPGRDDEDYLVPCMEVVDVEAPSATSSLCQSRLSGQILVRSGIIRPESSLWTEWLSGAPGQPLPLQPGWRPDTAVTLIELAELSIIVIGVSNFCAYGLGVTRVGKDGKYKRLGVLYTRSHLRNYGWDVEKRCWNAEAGLTVETVTLA